MSRRPHHGAGRRVLRIVAALAMLVPFVPLEARASESNEIANRSVASVDLFAPHNELSEGDRGPDVIRMQAVLRDAGFYRGPITGSFDHITESAVIAFQKYLDIERTGTFKALDWIRVDQLPAADIPFRFDEPDRVEVDTTRQLMYIVRDHAIVGILPTSTGSGATYYSVRQGRNVRSATPHGDFTLRWRQYGWNCDSTTGWCVYNYWAFTGFYGIHGYRNVPAYPASHGCTRVHLWDSDWLDDYLYVGMPMHVWRERPHVPLPAAELLRNDQTQQT